VKRLALCADDYGLNEGVSRGILKLAAQQRLTQTSCLVNAPAWAAFAPALRGSGLRAGLHLNLTEGRPLTVLPWPAFPSLPRLIALAHARRLPVAALRAEWRAQLDAFEQASGQPPSHIDGHQHVHHLPQLRELLWELLSARPGVAARHTGRVVGPGFALKRWLIENTGGRTLGQGLESRGRAQNRRLLGVYDFAPGRYRGWMRGWLAALASDGDLIFCHPGEAGDDAIDAARRDGLAYFAGPAFAEDLAAAGVQLG
jgi:hypothetical protein